MLTIYLKLRYTVEYEKDFSVSVVSNQATTEEA